MVLLMLQHRVETLYLATTQKLLEDIQIFTLPSLVFSIEYNNFQFALTDRRYEVIVYLCLPTHEETYCFYPVRPSVLTNRYLGGSVIRVRVRLDSIFILFYVASHIRDAL